MRISKLWILWLACFCLAPVAIAHDDFVESDCNAEMEVKLANRTEAEGTIRLEYEIDVTSDADCAEIRYDLVVNELLPNGQWKSFRRSRSVALRNGTFSDRVVHRMSADLKLLGHRVVVASCLRCDPE